MVTAIKKLHEGELTYLLKMIGVCTVLAFALIFALLSGMEYVGQVLIKERQWSPDFEMYAWLALVMSVGVHVWILFDEIRCRAAGPLPKDGVYVGGKIYVPIHSESDPKRGFARWAEEPRHKCPEPKISDHVMLALLDDIMNLEPLCGNPDCGGINTDPFGGRTQTQHELEFRGTKAVGWLSFIGLGERGYVHACPNTACSTEAIFKIKSSGFGKRKQHLIVRA